MQLFYAPEADFSRDMYTFSEEESRHIVRVLRMTVGEEVFLTDGQGTLARGEITDGSIKNCTVVLREVMPEFEQRPYRMHLAVAPTKNADRIEWMVEKATEIGVDTITLLLTEHSERRVLRTDRLEKIAVGAIKQSQKAYLPCIEPLIPFSEWVTRPFEGLKLIAHCEEGSDKVSMKSLVKPASDVLVLIGPEGDFSPAEIAQAVQNGFRPVSLGRSRLRTETAAIAAVHTVALINE